MEWWKYIRFIAQLVEECGVLCEGCSGDIDTDGDGIVDECDDCLNMSGDVNDDMLLDILDIVLVGNCVLSGGCDECSDLNYDGSVDVLDIVIMINIVLEL